MVHDGMTARERRRDGVGGRSKPRASLACVQCRQRKTKCQIDSALESCSACRALGVKCVFDGDRRKIASKEQITSLQDRLRYLEGLIGSQGAGPSQLGFQLPEHPGSPRLPSEDPEQPHGEPLSRLPSHVEGFDFEMTEAANAQGGQGQQHPTHNAESEIEIHPAAASGNGDDMPASMEDQFSFNMNRLTPPSEPDSARLEVDAESSQPLFYGPTSQRYIRMGLDDERATDMGQTKSLVNMDSIPVRQSLLQTFWKVQPLSQALVDQNEFEAAKGLQYKSYFWSLFLEHSMLACASRMSTSADIRALGARYADRATGDITEALQSPSMASLQGFLLMSDFEATRGRNRLGYMYCGIGCRMAFDLGLHENCADLIANGKMAASAVFSRHVLFLGAYVYDQMWGLYLGRPTIIPSSYLAAARRRGRERQWEVPSTLTAWVGLAESISEVTSTANGDTPLDLQALDSLSRLDARISAQCEALPTPIALVEEQISDLPAEAYGLHIQFRGIRIVLHRLLDKSVTQNSNALHFGYAGTAEHSRKVMRENAICIARLASAYQQIYGIESVITVMLDGCFVAAALLISFILHEQQDPFSAVTAENLAKSEEAEWLRRLAEILKDAQRHYPVTARMRSTLSALVEGTPLSGAFGTWTVSKKPTRSQSTGNIGQAPAPTANMGFPFSQNLLQDQEFFFATPFGDATGQVPQGMDTDNMFSWMLSPMG